MFEHVCFAFGPSNFSSIRHVWRQGDRYFLSHTPYFEPRAAQGFDGKTRVIIEDHNQRIRDSIDIMNEITPEELALRRVGIWTLGLPDT